MNLRRTLSVALALLAVTSIVSAQTRQTSAEALPPGPLIAENAPNFAQWTVTAKRSSGDAGPQGKERKPFQVTTQVVKTGDIRRVTTVTNRGGKSQVWVKGNDQIIVRPEWPQPLLSTGENKKDAARLDFSKGDFAGFEWISAANFVGVRKVAQRDCLVFQESIFPSGASEDEETGPSGSLAAGEKVQAVACTDLQTRLPVMLKVGEMTSTFKYGPTPQAVLALPQKYQSLIEERAQRVQKATRRPVRP